MSKINGKFNWWPVIIAGAIAGGAELMWSMYNNFVPLWLQAGNPAFEAAGETGLVGFGFGAFVTGIILTFDNIAALFIGPLTGVLSDSTRSRMGRRKPWILISAPIAIVVFVLIPVFALRIPPELNGQTELLKPYLIPFVTVLVILLLALAILHVPSYAIVFDITPSKHRTTANAIAVFAGGILGIGGAMGGAILFGMDPALPFWIGAGIVAIVVVLTAIYVKEPEESEYRSTESEGELSIKNIINTLRHLPKENTNSLIYLMLSIFFGWTGFASLQAFVSSYGLTVLHLDISLAALLFPIAGLVFLVGAFPASIVANRLGRKKAVIIGFVAFSVISLLLLFFSNQTLVFVCLALGGFFWAFVNVNIDPMVIDSAPSDLVLGSYNSLLSVAKTVGFILGPIAGGFIIEKVFGQVDYSKLWLAILVVEILAILTMLPVTKGEVRE